jgi:hypothetical protein
MTKDDAIEACAKAIIQKRGYRVEQWRDYPVAISTATNLIAALEALGLWKPTG